MKIPENLPDVPSAPSGFEWEYAGRNVYDLKAPYLMYCTHWDKWERSTLDSSPTSRSDGSCDHYMKLVPRKKTKVLNFWAGPGSGKSTLAAEAFAHFKKKGVNCELVPEFAKDLVWSGRDEQLKDQLFVFANHCHQFTRLVDKVDLIITDSPLLQSLVYTADGDVELRQLIKSRFEEFNNVNFYVDRCSAYNPAGRTQTEDEARRIDYRIKDLLSQERQPYTITTKETFSPGEIEL